eukprot:NODE_116_length_2461_cov_59.049337_g82_i0.p1 GENE.NODE_116_length_2461_cov_59.049337_g82_i0~~NODE_116_length_2461_cov_59.049337_g82_i0.p1  ORF type:complete len:782 (-),score=244.92 NODE_116_length_2461_cov_59.049337_g82_i0:116-2401(-)
MQAALILLVYLAGSVHGDCTTAPDVVVTNAAIHTMEPTMPTADTMAWKSEKITYIGTAAGATKCISDAALKINAQGKVITPGFHDIHLHPMEAASSFAACDILSSTVRLSSQTSTLRACASNNFIESDFALGWGHLINQIYDLIDEGQNPKTFLDNLSPAGKAMCIMEKTSHSVWCNSAALAKAKITTTTKIEGGIILKDSTGALNGVLLENAGNYMIDVAFTPSTSTQRAKRTEIWTAGLKTAMRTLNVNGITSITNSRAYWQRDVVPIWKAALAAGTLTTRTVLALWVYPAPNFTNPSMNIDTWDTWQLDKIKADFTDAAGLLRINQVKMYVDGIIHQSTARMLTKYQTGRWTTGLKADIPDGMGMYYFQIARLNKLVAALDAHGFDLHLHGIGDGGVRAGLDSIAAARTANTARTQSRRHHITHAEYIHADDRSRFKSLDVIADMQVGGEESLPKNYAWDAEMVGTTIANGRQPIKSIINAGGRAGLSSDWDVHKPSPFLGISNALQRGTETLTVDEAVAAYTINGAWSMRHDDITGSLKVGKYADFAVLSQDIWSVSASQVASTTIYLTMLGGKEVWRDTNNFPTSTTNTVKPATSGTTTSGSTSTTGTAAAATTGAAAATGGAAVAAATTTSGSTSNFRTGANLVTLILTTLFSSYNEANVKRHLATALGVSATNIIITNARSGSTILTFRLDGLSATAEQNAINQLKNTCASTVANTISASCSSISTVSFSSATSTAGSVGVLALALALLGVYIH